LPPPARIAKSERPSILQIDHGCHESNFQVSGDDVDVTAIVVNYNTRDLLRPCLDKLRESAAGLRLQIVIVDNASRDGSAETLRADFADCDLLFNATNVGFGRANNQALALARGRYLLLLNTDAFVAPDSVGNTVDYLNANPECGLLGVRLIGRDGTLQPSCRYFPTPWNEFLSSTGFDRFFPGTRLVDDMNWAHDSPRECDWVPGCYYLVRRSVVDDVGLFDPRFFLYYEEVDHCRAVKAAGWKVVFYSGTTIVHIGGESAKSDSAITSNGRQISALQIESGLLYYRKQYGLPGLVACLVLLSLGDAILACKALIRSKSVRAAVAQLDHATAMWSLLRGTRWATRPTR
jgi:N-acetylglucosaminyl-diphospho-decaprenol L-rhamnosyltransferase